MSSISLKSCPAALTKESPEFNLNTNKRSLIRYKWKEDFPYFEKRKKVGGDRKKEKERGKSN